MPSTGSLTRCECKLSKLLRKREIFMAFHLAKETGFYNIAGKKPNWAPEILKQQIKWGKKNLFLSASNLPDGAVMGGNRICHTFFQANLLEHAESCWQLPGAWCFHKSALGPFPFFRKLIQFPPIFFTPGICIWIQTQKLVIQHGKMNVFSKIHPF